MELIAPSEPKLKRSPYYPSSTVMTRSGSNTHNSHGSRHTRDLSLANLPNGATTSRQTVPVVAGGDLRDQIKGSRRGAAEDLWGRLTNNRSLSGTTPPAPPPVPTPQEKAAALEQAATALNRVAAGLRRGAPTPQPPPSPREHEGPSTLAPRAPATPADGEVNSPRPSERRDEAEASRGRHEQREERGTRPTRATSALGRLSPHVPVQDRLGPRPAADARPAESSCSRRSRSREPRAPGPREPIPPVERSGETRGRPLSSQRDEMEQLRRQMRELQRKMEARDESPEPRDALATPFTKEVMAEPLPWDFRFPAVKPYTGATDPQDHLNRYKAVMMMTGVNDTIMCRGFCTTLDGQAQD
ncbi:PREDICTED: serine/arginine repetitive matrix protein 1-like [Ipomoea nil]|uniref:serine/arginine repetitive matrix protein 1-like n=1 Tax=Ipomoea nil TaxID=35883 RepID=UPI00090094D3|nr:PREDICTED: serine/arginine repetitive matrix protein 1-like [Ipomoea nil]